MTDFYRIGEWNAGELVEAVGPKLIGQRIWTRPLGAWPGGLCTVIDLNTDPSSPDIVMQVTHKEHGDIGVFSSETVELCDHISKFS